jgi:hypothetical protein
VLVVSKPWVPEVVEVVESVVDESVGEGKGS